MHKNLEDNYGAVITANHEAIAQILEQVNQPRFVKITTGISCVTPAYEENEPEIYLQQLRLQ